jgi:beta-barrel assembly-enhancing protease
MPHRARLAPLRSSEMSRSSRAGRPARTALVTGFVLAAAMLSAQTRITPPKNSFRPEQDVQIGREAAAEVRRQYPVIDDPEIAQYLDSLGRRLVAAAPPELNNPAFEYSFTPVNLKEINAFALPGGPMFVNRGMFDAASSEGEVVGVMAHELSHVLLRHGTANATKAQNFQLGALAGAIAGAVVGGGWGRVISKGSQFSLGSWLLKYSREYERQADLLGAQIMARAGYDPRDLGRMFETIERESRSGGGPEFLSSHPNPGNRSAYIAREAEQLQIATRPEDPRSFDYAKSEFASLPRARSMGEVPRREPASNAPESVGVIGRPVPAPSTQYRTTEGGRLFQVNVPSNWQAVASNNAIKFVPMNAYGQAGNERVFTHGVELGVARASSRDLRSATESLLTGWAQQNPDLRLAGQQATVVLSQRQAIGTPLTNRSALGSTERIGLYTTFLADGNLFYYLTIVPEEEAGAYADAFRRVGSSIRLRDR